MKEPAEYLQPLLFAIETTAIKIYEEFPKLMDREIETAYEKLAHYYKEIASKKNVDEPELPNEKTQIIIDELLNLLDEREEEQLDSFIINNPDTRHGEHLIPSLPLLYHIAFKRLQKSVRFWRKKNGAKGYINYLAEFF